MSFTGLCHDCKSSGVETELDEFKKPICLSCREELAVIRRKEAKEQVERQ